MLLVALAIAILSGIAAALIVLNVSGRLPYRDASATRFPLTQAVDDFSCPRGLTRLALMRGVEDGFAPAGREPASVDPRLLRSRYYADLATPRSSPSSLRAYDTGGKDRTLLDYFDVPAGVVSGKLLLRIRPAGAGADNDGMRIGDLDPFLDPGLERRSVVFGIDRFWDEPGPVDLADGSALWTRDIVDMAALDRHPSRNATLADYLAQADRPLSVDLSIADDTAVDALALLLCHVPREARGVTLAEHRFKPSGPALSWLTCSMDMSQASCDPFTGDQSCSLPSPVACYHDGARTPPQDLWTKGISPTAFVGGEVRMTAPVRGDAFPRLDDANAFCQAQFGSDWRVLSYHEGGGGSVASFSNIAPLTRGLVNIRDQQYANCWDRGVRR